VSAPTVPAGYVSVVEHCCPPADMLWAIEELMVAVSARVPLPSAAVDALPPGRARLVVRVCLAAGARLAQGDDDFFEQAAEDAVRADPGGRGWWSRALAGRDRPF
jgi:hypothetical protein